MKRFMKIISIILILLLTCGCRAQTEGDTLHAFTERINNLSDTYQLDENGYILDKNERTLSRFYKFDENEILLRFRTDENNKLYEMSLVFNEICVEKTQEINFIENCLTAYIDDETTQKKLYSKTELEKALKTKSNKTQKTKSGDTEFLLDVTDYGIVITVVKNNL
ncbi:MAG: hypothetical protein IJ025_08360 [Clostridia bacterium]|nr:hypothetical protein [Clostridia bacterium]